MDLKRCHGICDALEALPRLPHALLILCSLQSYYNSAYEYAPSLLILSYFIDTLETSVMGQRL
jgi:hypothetical protein